jgi:hypothetical protein
MSTSGLWKFLMREKVLKLKYPEYSYKVDVIITDDIITSRNDRSDIIGSTYKDNEPLGLFAYDNTKEFEPKGFIFLPPESSIDTISHEVVHMIKRIFDRIGSCLDDSSEEIFAYNVGYASGKIHKFIKKHKKEFD